MGRWRGRHNDYFGARYWPAYVPVATRIANAQKKVDALRKKGVSVSPVHIEGRAIAKTFWGKSWCDNLEGYADYSNRLPRGRSYVCNGSVVDLRVERGHVHALVMGSDLYTVDITIHPVEARKWKTLVGECSGRIESMIELLQGKLSKAVMETVTRQQSGLFPSPKEIQFKCSCPDWASMCKHVAATLYGVGARLDESPQMMFTLRGVDAADLVVDAGALGAVTKRGAHKALQAQESELADLFGIELGTAKEAKGKKPTRPTAQPPVPAKVQRSGKAPPSARDTRDKKAPAVARPAVKTPKIKGRGADARVIDDAELRARGIPEGIVEYWLDAGLLRRASVAGKFEMTPEVAERIDRFAAKPASKVPRRRTR